MMLTVAMPKGRIFAEALVLLKQAGYEIPDDLEHSRKLMIDVPNE